MKDNLKFCNHTSIKIQELVLEKFEGSDIKKKLKHLKEQSQNSKYACTKQYWTILAAFVIETGDHEYTVASMGCGTKSLGKKFMRDDGLALNDSHAEILARRGLLLYL